MSDPAERYYSPPPPSGLGERMRLHRRSLVGAAVILLLIGATFAIALAVSGDGKNSGHPERAFGGYISPSDQDALAEVGIARNNANTAYVGVLRAAHRRHLAAVRRAADSGRAVTTRGLAATSRITNDDLRSVLARLLTTQRKVFVAYGQLTSYVMAHRGDGVTPKVNQLVDRTKRAEAAARESAAQAYARIAPYMSPEQRRQALEGQRAFESQVREAGG